MEITIQLLQQTLKNKLLNNVGLSEAYEEILEKFYVVTKNGGKELDIVKYREWTYYRDLKTILMIDGFKFFNDRISII